jgi:hypothetical protein
MLLLLRLGLNRPHTHDRACGRVCRCTRSKPEVLRVAETLPNVRRASKHKFDNVQTPLERLKHGVEALEEEVAQQPLPTTPRAPCPSPSPFPEVRTDPLSPGLSNVSPRQLVHLGEEGATAEGLGGLGASASGELLFTDITGDPVYAAPKVAHVARPGPVPMQRLLERGLQGTSCGLDSSVSSASSVDVSGQETVLQHTGGLLVDIFGSPIVQQRTPWTTTHAAVMTSALAEGGGKFRAASLDGRTGPGSSAAGIAPTGGWGADVASVEEGQLPDAEACRVAVLADALQPETIKTSCTDKLSANAAYSDTGVSAAAPSACAQTPTSADSLTCEESCASCPAAVAETSGQAVVLSPPFSHASSATQCVAPQPQVENSATPVTAVPSRASAVEVVAVTQRASSMASSCQPHQNFNCTSDLGTSDSRRPPLSPTPTALQDELDQARVLLTLPMAAFCERARSEVATLDAQHTAVLSHFRDLLHFFAQPVPNDSSLRGQEPENFFGHIWALVERVEAAAKETAKLEECLSLLHVQRAADVVGGAKAGS